LQGRTLGRPVGLLVVDSQKLVQRSGYVVGVPVDFAVDYRHGLGALASDHMIHDALLQQQILVETLLEALIRCALVGRGYSLGVIGITLSHFAAHLGQALGGVLHHLRLFSQSQAQGIGSNAHDRDVKFTERHDAG